MEWKRQSEWMDGVDRFTFASNMIFFEFLQWILMASATELLLVGMLFPFLSFVLIVRVFLAPAVYRSCKPTNSVFFGSGTAVQRTQTRIYKQKEGQRASQ